MSSVWRKSSKRARARSTTHATHSDQANRTALWVFNLGVTLPCPLAPCVTTPTLQHHCLPNVTTTVTKSRGNELLRTPLRRSSQNFDQPKFAFWGFSEVGLPLYGVLGSSAGQALGSVLILFLEVPSPLLLRPLWTHSGRATSQRGAS